MGRYVFKLPDVGEGTAEAELVGWHVKVGDMVAEDQIVADVMTDKATVEITSPVAGKVSRLHGEPGQMLAVRGPLVEFEVEGAGNAGSEAPPSEPAAQAPVPPEGGQSPEPHSPPAGGSTGEAGEGGHAAPASGANYVFKLPDVGEGTAEAELVGWHVAVGDAVAEDQILAEVMTDKATVEITSPVAGHVVALHGEPGRQMAVGGPLVSFVVEGKGNVAAAAASPSTASRSSSPSLRDGEETSVIAPASPPRSEGMGRGTAEGGGGAGSPTPPPGRNHSAIICGSSTVALRATRRICGENDCSRPSPSDSRSPRLPLQMAWTSSSTTQFRSAKYARAPAQAQNRASCSGVVSRMSGGNSRWR